MIFSSYEFIFLFIPVSWLGFFFLARRSHNAAISWLVLCSFFFYGWWDVRYVPLMGGSMLFNYYLGSLLGKQAVSRAGQKKIIVIAGISANLMLLGYFKYTDFMIDNINGMFSTNIGLLYITLPLAISFFTFQQIAYLVDAYQGKTREYSLINYSLFVTFFPQLIAGPIVHHKEMLPQFALSVNKNIRIHNVVKGLTIFILGFFKKAVIADGIAPYSNKIFAAALNGEAVSFFDAWGGALAYTCQLYFDFSGYADMAIGAALLFNIRLPINFNSPYKSLSISEFWRRWHMTLSRFLRDYLYIPLGGSRRGRSRQYVNMIITMLLGGIWHGAGWTFFFWGLLHGLYLTVNQVWNAVVKRSPRLLALRKRVAYRLIAWAITFICVVVGWVFFRAESFAATQTILAGMVGLNGVVFPERILAAVPSLLAWAQSLGIETRGGIAKDFILTYAWITVALVIAFLFPNTSEFTRLKWINSGSMTMNWSAVPIRWGTSGRWALLLGVMAAISTLALTRAGEFLYFQF